MPKIGASVESDPSMSPTIAGWTRWSRKAFPGWAAQPGLRTVEETVRDALASIFSTASGLVVAGRTDTGVHALANVASFDVRGGPPTEHAAEVLNTALPD